jgi:hypothetical protein
MKQHSIPVNTSSTGRAPEILSPAVRKTATPVLSTTVHKIRDPKRQAFYDNLNATRAKRGQGRKARARKEQEQQQGGAQA